MLIGSCFRDVDTFVPAISKILQFWNDQQICAITQAISLPGLSIRLMERNVDPNVIYFLAGKKASHMNDVLRKGIIGRAPLLPPILLLLPSSLFVGGLSIVWNRMAIAGVSTIKGGGKHVVKVVGYDANR